MIDKRIKIDLTPLWNEQTDKFIVRFQDINEIQKRKLAQRIKDLAKQRSIKKAAGPTVQTIYETLLEINPIIFGEYNANNQYRPQVGYKVFNLNNIRTIGGYWFHQLCQAVYMITCVKRELNKKELIDIASLICQDWQKIDNYINENYRYPEEEERQIRNLIPEEIELADIQRARKVAEDNGANRIPDGVFESEDETQDIINQLANNESFENEYILEVRPERNNNRIYTRIDRTMDGRERGVRREPAVERIQREIDHTQNRTNPHEMGSYNWNMEERARAHLLESLLEERERLINEENRRGETRAINPEELRRRGYFEIEANPTPTDYNWTMAEDQVLAIDPAIRNSPAFRAIMDDASL